MSDTMTLHCPHCRADTDFEQPPCGDGHDGDCPDLVCVVCGLALFSFVADDLVARRRTRRSRAA